MIRFQITVRTEFGKITYPGISYNGFDLHEDAVDRFFPCAITVRPA